MRLDRCAALFAALAMLLGLSPLTAVADTASGTSVVGSIVDTDGGLAIPGAGIDLYCQGAHVQHTTTARDGSFFFNDVTPGVCTLLVTASGYQLARSANIPVAAGARVEFRVALTRISSAAAARTIGRVIVAASNTLQTSSTINTHIDPSILQTQNYMRAGDALISVPGVNIATSSSLGDDQSVSIRGFEATETATLLDGHPIGPIGALGNGFDYQDSPFFGIRDIETVFGSGATGVYGASTIAGAVNFLTINPTPQIHALFEQGAGSYGKALTGIQTTGTENKLGFAFSHGVEGTYGLFPPSDQVESGLNGSDIRAATFATNTYVVSSDYVLRNDVGKLTYAFSPKTNFLLSAYSATTWDDKSGNGDNDFLTYQQNLYNTFKGLNGNGGKSSVCLSSCGTPQEVDGNCSNFTQAALSDAPAGFSCLNPYKFSQETSGPSGGGGGPWQAIRNQDYHARLTQGLGQGQINVDTYIDKYGLDYNRAAANQSFHSDFYRTTGLLIDDEFASTLHNIAFGYNYQHQQHTGDTFPFFDQNGNQFNILAANQEFDLNQNNFFARDEYTPNSKLSIFANLWLNHSANTGKNSFDPRLTFQFRPTGVDIVRLTAGHSNSEPDPSLLYAMPSYNTTPNNINPLCGAQLNGIGSVSNPTLSPETATDAEVSYGRRIGLLDTLEVDVYNTTEFNALFSGNLPLSALGSTQVPPSLIAAYLRRIQNFCHNNPTVADLAVSTTYNAASARYRGIQLSGNFGLLPHFTANADYDVQSSTYLGVPDAILASNVTIINGSQIYGIPLHKANLGFDYNTPSGLDVEIDGHYIGDGNSYNRPHFIFTNASISQQANRITTTLGINNIFNTAAQRYGYFGLGVFQPENKFGADQNAFDQSSEEFGIPPLQYFFTMTYKV